MNIDELLMLEGFNAFERDDYTHNCIAAGNPPIVDSCDADKDADKRDLSRPALPNKNRLSLHSEWNEVLRAIELSDAIASFDAEGNDTSDGPLGSLA